MLLEVRIAVIFGAIVPGRKGELISGVLVMLFPDLGTGYMSVFVEPCTYDMHTVLYSFYIQKKVNHHHIHHHLMGNEG